MSGMPQQFQQPWMNPGMQVPFYQQPQYFGGGQAFQQQVPQEKPLVEVEEVKETMQDKVNDEVQQTSNSMIEVLSKSDNPKHRNSKFLKFLKKLSTGAYTIENEQLVKVPEKLSEFKVMEAERLKEEAVREAEEAKQQSNVSVNQEKFDQFSKLWNNEDNLDEEQCK